jgi:hypothetical protein
MHLMPTNVQLTLTRRMSTLRLVCSFYRMASRLQLLPMALHRCLATFIHKLTSQRRFMDLLLLSGALHTPRSRSARPRRWWMGPTLGSDSRSWIAPSTAEPL